MRTKLSELLVQAKLISVVTDDWDSSKTIETIEVLVRENPHVIIPDSEHREEYPFLWIKMPDGGYAGWCFHDTHPLHVKDGPPDLFGEKTPGAPFPDELQIEGVPLGAFLKPDGRTPTEAAESFATRPYEVWYGGTQFAAIPTPQGWGFVRTTISNRDVIWLPFNGGTVITIRLKESETFRSWTLLEYTRGGGKRVTHQEPEWLKAAIEKKVGVERPIIDEDPNEEPEEGSCQEFLAAIATDPT